MNSKVQISQAGVRRNATHGLPESGAPEKYPEPASGGSRGPRPKGGNFMGKKTATQMTQDLPFGAIPKTLRRMSRPERRVMHRIGAAILAGAIPLPAGFLDGRELTHLHAATEKIELKRRRGK